MEGRQWPPGVHASAGCCIGNRAMYPHATQMGSQVVCAVFVQCVDCGRQCVDVTRGRELRQPAAANTQGTDSLIRSHTHAHTYSGCMFARCGCYLLGVKSSCKTCCKRTPIHTTQAHAHDVTICMCGCRESFIYTCA